ncbi:MAG: hypothetical protein U1C97_02475, partial [Candidatus Gracilibacteria bacterium]|nr:hypothetical protein [Candidatus Gracilibacteria bacterium]
MSDSPGGSMKAVGIFEIQLGTNTQLVGFLFRGSLMFPGYDSRWGRKPKQKFRKERRFTNGLELRIAMFS